MSAPLRDSLPEHGIIAGIGGGPAESAIPLLLVDDDPEMLRTLTFYFERRRFAVRAVATLAAAKAAFSSHPKWALVIADHHLPDGRGWELFCWIRERCASSPPLLLISGATDAAVYADRVEFLAKPFSLDDLDRRVGALLTPD